MSTDPRDLYLDFDRHSTDLVNQVQLLRRSYRGAFLPEVAAECNILASFTQSIFPEGFIQSCFASNISLSDEAFCLAFRPRVDGPRLEQLLPHNSSVCVVGTPSPEGDPNPLLVVKRITIVPNSDAQDFERECFLIPISSPARFARDPNRNLLKADFLFSLPIISAEAKRHLERWSTCLEWKKQCAQFGVTGLRYWQVDLKGDLLSFWVAAESAESFAVFRRFLRDDRLAAVDLTYSRDPWAYRYHGKEKFDGASAELGNLNKVSILEGFPSSLPDCPWKTPCLAQVSFHLTNRDQELFKEHAASDHEEVRRSILAMYPSEGFLALTVRSDLVVLDRQSRRINNLVGKAGNNPFLASWLFDIKRASGVKDTVRINHWHDQNLNESQKDGIRTVLNATGVALIQGPPGTGKTTMIAEAIRHLVKRGKKVLVASQTHLAVDNVMERLAGDPEIRAVRLGKIEKISEEGLQFTGECALQGFYQAIATKCGYKFLNMWEECEQRARRLEEWIRLTDFVHADLMELRANAKSESDALEDAISRVREEENRLERLTEENTLISRQIDHLHRFKQYLESGQDTTFSIPEVILDVVWRFMIKPVNGLKDLFIDINPFWSGNKGFSQGERSLFFKQILSRWNDLMDLVPRVETDLSRIKALSGDVVIALEDHLILEQLKAECKLLEEAMEQDESKYQEWLEVRKRMRGLKKGSSALDGEIYSRIFTGTNGETPYYVHLIGPNKHREDLIEILAQALHAIRIVKEQFDKGLLEVRRLVDEQLSIMSLHPVDRQTVSVLDVEARTIRLRLEEMEKSVVVKTNELAHLLRRVQTEKLVPAPVREDYEAVRSQAEQEIDRNQSALRSVEELRSKWEQFLRQWVADLNNPETASADADICLDTYIKNANVVGVSCNEGPLTLFIAGHSAFDVVFIDEVSKATLPELLMPMMMATTTILVGDHRQLPPLFKEGQTDLQDMLKRLREDGSEETVEMFPLLTEENYHRFEKLLTASLFKQHFETADDSLKSSLTVQYRMHPDIMQTVNHFYEYNLQCGLKDPDTERDHGLTVTSDHGDMILTPSRHALWIDSSHDPVGQPHMEKQAGTSKVNLLEALLIMEMLVRIDEACGGNANYQGIAKTVGVISFYGRQIRLLKQLVRKQSFKAITVDVNTVDRFQGKEKDFVLVSLVRNRHVAKKSHNAFVAQFERINVAFSRARELLLIFGAKNMFYDYPVEMPHMRGNGSDTKFVYRFIIDELHRKGCFWPSERILAEELYMQRLKGLEV